MLSFPSDPPKSFLSEVRARLHDSQDAREPYEVKTLRGSQRMFFEERDHNVRQVGPPLHGEAEERFPMVVVAGVLDDVPATELLNEDLECGAR